MDEKDRTVVVEDGELRLSKSWRMHPQPFISEVPFIGSLIAALRQTWYNVAARWQDQLLLDQQNQLRQEIAELRRNQEYLTHLLSERGMEIGLLGEKVAQVALKIEQDEDD